MLVQTIPRLIPGSHKVGRKKLLKLGRIANLRTQPPTRQRQLGVYQRTSYSTPSRYHHRINTRMKTRLAGHRSQPAARVQQMLRMTGSNNKPRVLLYLKVASLAAMWGQTGAKAPHSRMQQRLYWPLTVMQAAAKLGGVGAPEVGCKTAAIVVGRGKGVKVCSRCKVSKLMGVKLNGIRACCSLV